MNKVVIEISNGKILGVYGSEDMELIIYEDMDDTILADEELDAIDEVVASVPYVLYQIKE